MCITFYKYNRKCGYNIFLNKIYTVGLTDQNDKLIMSANEMKIFIKNSLD